LGVKSKTSPHKNIYVKKTSKMAKMKWRHIWGRPGPGRDCSTIRGWMSGWIKQCYNPNHKLMLGNNAVKTNKCDAARNLRFQKQTSRGGGNIKTC
jgi:hypothetical protein